MSYAHVQAFRVFTAGRRTVKRLASSAALVLVLFALDACGSTSGDRAGTGRELTHADALDAALIGGFDSDRPDRVAKHLIIVGKVADAVDRNEIEPTASE
ncbi:MAG TPA: hypothetical protein VN802_13815 [Stellaceae bacterium]|nr:hypothetical protein [Stellaceae bacterium]